LKEWQELQSLIPGMNRKQLAYFDKLTIRNSELKIGSFVELEGNDGDEELGRVGRIDCFIECESNIVVDGGLY